LSPIIILLFITNVRFRDLSSKLPDIEYPEGYMVRKVIWNGFVFIGRRPLYITKCLAGAHIGFEAISKHKSRVWYRDVKLGGFNSKKWKIERLRRHPQSAGVNPCSDENKPIKVLPKYRLTDGQQGSE
jgi:hypothetical protein